MATQKKIPGYETAFATRIDVSDEALKTFKEKIESTIQKFEGEVVYWEDWGKVKLAYPIKKEVRAQYSFVVYTGTPGVVAEIERNLRIFDGTLRFMTDRIAEEFEKDDFFKKYPAGTPMKKQERAPGSPATPTPRSATDESATASN